MNDIMNESSIVKEYDFIKPEIDEVVYLLDKVIEVCRKNYFYTYKFRCLYDTKFRNITNKDKIILKTSLDCLEFKSEFCGLNGKIKNAKYNKFSLDEIEKLPMKIYSSRSNINKHYYLKLQKPIMHRQFFKKIHLKIQIMFTLIVMI